MGWLWSSSSSTSTSTSASSSTPPQSSSISSSTSSSTSPPPPPPPQQTPPSSPEADPEVQKFLALLSSDSSSSSPSSSSSSSSTSPSSSSDPPNAISAWFSSKLQSPPPPPQPPTLSPLSEALLPTDISCRQAFDLAWSCNSLGGQWNAVYRHGTMRSCSPHWDAFWFCMRTKSFSGPAREAAVREHYRRIEYEKYYAPGRRSSEDVWEPRTHRVAEGTAFVQPIDLPAVNDEDWRRAEDERRGKIRKDLGF